MKTFALIAILGASTQSLQLTQNPKNLQWSQTPPPPQEEQAWDSTVAGGDMDHEWDWEHDHGTDADWDWEHDHGMDADWDWEHDTGMGADWDHEWDYDYNMDHGDWNSTEWDHDWDYNMDHGDWNQTEWEHNQEWNWEAEVMEAEEEEKKCTEEHRHELQERAGTVMGRMLKDIDSLLGNKDENVTFDEVFQVLERMVKYGWISGNEVWEISEALREEFPQEGMSHHEAMAYAEGIDSCKALHEELNVARQVEALLDCERDGAVECYPASFW